MQCIYFSLFPANLFSQKKNRKSFYKLLLDADRWIRLVYKYFSTFFTHSFLRIFSSLFLSNPFWKNETTIKVIQSWIFIYSFFFLVKFKGSWTSLTKKWIDGNSYLNYFYCSLVLPGRISQNITADNKWF